VRCRVAVLLCSIAAASVPATASAAARCRGAGVSVQRLGAVRAAAVTLCALNRERAARGLRALRLDRRLAAAARAHSVDMVAHRYFAHASRDGRGFAARIAGTGWTRRRGAYRIGEDIAYGSGGRATPRAIVAAWMRSAAHRANILQPRFRVAGIGVAGGTPYGRRGATYSADFGS
jgi:uncharacterized protein YkwD